MITLTDEQRIFVKKSYYCFLNNHNYKSINSMYELIFYNKVYTINSNFYFNEFLLISGVSKKVGIVCFNNDNIYVYDYNNDDDRITINNIIYNYNLVKSRDYNIREIEFPTFFCKRERKKIRNKIFLKLN
jgi:hypothetical protein